MRRSDKSPITHLSSDDYAAERAERAEWGYARAEQAVQNDGPVGWNTHVHYEIGLFSVITKADTHRVTTLYQIYFRLFMVVFWDLMIIL